MSKKPETKSGEESGPLGGSYVYDFLYHDARRVGSILSQLGKYGHLTALKHNATTGESSSSKSALTGSGGVPGVGAAGASGEDQTSEQYGEGLERSYDPHWTNALELYEKLDQSRLLARDLASARIGQFVICTGTLSVIDLKVLEGAWKSPTVKKMITKGALEIPAGEEGFTAKQRAESRTAREQTTSLMYDLLQLMPHLVQASLWTGDHSVWATLEDKSLVTSAAEITLRHGSTLAGRWSVLGILDATAGDEGDQVIGTSGITANQLSSTTAFGGTPIGQAAIALGPITRTMMGRPTGAFAMTPILIFREVSGS